MANNSITLTINSIDKWYFTKEQLESTPSIKCGYDKLKELSHRQQTANFIQDMGQRLKVTQLCINTAIVYMHRFYLFHSFTHFPWHQMAAAAIFLAAKVEEQPRKLEYVIRCGNICRNSKDVNIDVNSERYQAQSQDLVFNENVLLQTLGFDVAIDHPHTHVVRLCHLVRASKDLAQSSYFLASNSLHLTTMCLQYKPTVVACFCVHLACKWSRWEIPLSTENKEWFLYVDTTVTGDLLRQLTDEFFTIFETCPSRLKEKIMAIGCEGGLSNALASTPFDTEPRRLPAVEDRRGGGGGKSGSESDLHNKHRSRPHDGASTSTSTITSSSSSSSSSSNQQQREREYREKKEREKLAQQQHGLKSLPSSSQGSSNNKQISHGHHRPSSSSSSSSSIDPKMKQHSRQQIPPVVNSNSTSSTNYSLSRIEPRDILREAATKDSPFGIATNIREQHNNNNLVRDNKDIKRDYLLKSNVTDSTNNLTNNYYNKLNNNNSDSNNKQQQKIDLHRMKSIDQNKLVKSQKSENEIKRHLSATTTTTTTTSHENKNNYLNKSTNSTTTSQKIKSPFTTTAAATTTTINTNTTSADTSKSVPKSSNILQQQIGSLNKHQHNGNNNNNPLYNLPALDNEIKIKQESYNVKDEIVTPTIIKRTPSLFSPLENDSKINKESYNVKDEIVTPTIIKRTPSLFSPLENDSKLKKESYNLKDEIVTPLIVNRPQSLFSPPGKTSPHNNKKYNNLTTTTIKTSPKLTITTSSTQDNNTKRLRNTYSEPELRPVLKKLDTIDGFEDLLLNQSKIGINKLHQIPELITPFTDTNNKLINEQEEKQEQVNYSKEMKPPDIIPPMSCDNNNITIGNGIETNPTLISNLLKETTHQQIHLPITNRVLTSSPHATSSSLNTTATSFNLYEYQHQQQQQNNNNNLTEQNNTSALKHNEIKEKEHHHKSKKKNKDKHKHKDKNRDEKKKKHKDKERHKHKVNESASSMNAPPMNAPPIKLKIQKDKIHTITTTIEQQPNIPLKIKIPKDVIKTETLMNDDNNLTLSRSSSTIQSLTTTPSIGGLKIKIPKDKINNCNNNSGDIIGGNNTIINNRKRERTSPGDYAPTKISRSSSNNNHRESNNKQNGRHSYNKVSQMGDGDTSIHRLAESKYINKNSSS